ncbi:MAG: argininosuccinate synthase [Methanomicrobiales archaeon]|nr:argininosuccinate synthase [Methanomicrobiales archaeon]MDI6876445.1 argininosuccinate synthase [Methanomicrobiales archaeon]
MGNGTVVLAYSGGLDTSICIPLLKEHYSYERVVTAVVDVGQPKSDIDLAEKKGRALADDHYTIDAREDFVNGHVFPSIRANGCYEGYPLGTALARPLIAGKIVDLARDVGADAIAHGCTGKGNDQLRFDFIIRSAGFRLIAPVRELNLTRDWEIEYARKHNIPCQAVKENPYSIDENCWNRSIEGGRLEDPAFHPPEEIYRWTASVANSPDTPEVVSIGFSDGVPVSLNGERLKGIDLVQRMNAIAGRHGVGRNDMIEDRILGLKAREVYEHPAATALITAHRDLEGLVLTRQELAFKAIVDERWSELAYMGLVHEPLFDALNAFIDKTQERVTGIVDLQLFKGQARPIGRSSPFALYAGDLVSFDSTALDQCTAEGFSRYFGLQAQLLQQVRRRARKE